jgi:hypothetical protein
MVADIVVFSPQYRKFTTKSLIMALTGLLPYVRWRVTDANGTPLAGAKLSSYEAQTTTPLALYADAALTTALSNPVVSDSGGLFPELFTLPQSYYIKLTDADDVLVWDADNVADIGALLTGLTQVKYCTTQLDATTNTTLANVTGWTGFTLIAGGVYTVEINLSGTSGGSGGLKVAFKYTTATLTNLDVTAQGFTASAVAVQHITSTSDQASLFAQTAAVISVRIVGRITVNVAGTLAIQAAQNASNGTTSSVYIGSWARLIQTNA